LEVEPYAIDHGVLEGHSDRARRASALYNSIRRHGTIVPLIHRYGMRAI